MARFVVTLPCLAAGLLAARALAADPPLPGDCGALSLAEDGSCAGSVGVWAGPSRAMASAVPTPDGRLLVGDDWDKVWALVDPHTGATVSLLPPFGMETTWLLVTQGGTDLVATVVTAGERTFYGPGLRRLVGDGWVDVPVIPGVESAGRVERVDGGYVRFADRGTAAGGEQVWFLAEGASAWTRWADLPSPRHSPWVMPADGEVLVCGGRPVPGEAPPLPTCLVGGPKGWKEQRLPFAAGEFEGAVRTGAQWLVKAEGKTWVYRPEELGFTVLPGVPAREGYLSEGAGGAAALYDEHGVVAWWRDGGWRPLPPPPADTQLLPFPEGGGLRRKGIEELWLERPGEAPVRLDGGGQHSTTALPGGGLAQVEAGGGWRLDPDGVLHGLPELPLPFHGCGLAAFPDGTLWVGGGTDGNFQPLLPTYTWSPGAASWTARRPLPEGIAPRTLEVLPTAVLDGKLYLFGPAGERGARRVAGWRWDRATDTWSALPTPPFEVGQVAVVGKRLFALSRHGEDAPTKEGGAAWYDPARGAWEPLGTKPGTVHAGIVPLADGRVVVLAGGGPFDHIEPTRQAWLVSADGKAWSPLTLRFERRDARGLQLPDGRVFIVGGDHARAELLDVATGRSLVLPPTLRDRDGATLSLLADGRLAIGGETITGPGVRMELYTITGAPLFTRPADPTLDRLDGLGARCLSGDRAACAEAAAGWEQRGDAATAARWKARAGG